MPRRQLRSSTTSASSDLSSATPTAATLRTALAGDLSRRLFGKRLLLAIPVTAAAVLAEHAEDAHAAPTPTPWALIGNDNIATDGTNFLGTQNNAPLIFKTNTKGGGGERMRITPDGNVGIGVTNPSAKLSVQSGNAIAMSGEATALDARAISGRASASTGATCGVYGYAASVSGVGVRGESLSNVGVVGESSSGYGVRGKSDSNVGVVGESSSGYGVRGKSDSNVGVVGDSPITGVYGKSSAGTGVYGSSSSGYGVRGKSDSNVGVVGDSPTTGVYGNSSVGTGVYGSSTSGYGVRGKSDSNVGVIGESPTTGVYGTSAVGTGVYGSSSSGSGVSGSSSSYNGVYGASSSGIGVRGESSSLAGVAGQCLAQGGTGVFGYSPAGMAIYGLTDSQHSGYAGYFFGRVSVTGNLSKGGGSFKIDHPLDPENKYLYHSFVESPDMMNIYNGNVTLASDGTATVELPAWFEALNKDFRYQLTAIGAPGPNLHIAATIKEKRFTIAGGAPGMDVSWQVTGIRQDAYAETHRIPVEQDKPEKERGKYLYPKEHGQPEEHGIVYKQRSATLATLNASALPKPPAEPAAPPSP
jgi:hypothetical protein